MSKQHRIGVSQLYMADWLAGRQRWVMRAIIPRPADEEITTGDWIELCPVDRLDAPSLIAEVVGVQALAPRDAHCTGHEIYSLGAVGYAPVLQFRLDDPPGSMKNGRRLTWETAIVKGKVKQVPKSRKSKSTAADMRRIAGRAKEALADRMGSLAVPWGEDDAVRIDVLHDIETDEVLVRAMRVGTLPKGNKEKRGTKRDVHGMIETICDALRGVWFEDDRQVDMAVQQRVR